MRDSVVFYRSFYEAVNTLSPDEKLKAMEYMLEYGFYSKEPEGNTSAYGMFLMARPQIDANIQRYENGKKGGRKPKDIQNSTESEPKHIKKETETEPRPNQNLTKTEPNVNVNDNVNDIKENTLKGVKEKRFAPPTLENVRGYCQEKGYNIDAERFIDFYESKGWMIGKNKMKDWKAAVRNWVRQDKDRGREKSAQKPVNRFQNFDQSGTDYDALVNKKLRERMGGGG